MVAARAMRDSDAGSVFHQHIIDALARGVRRDELESLLLRAGWPREVVAECLGRVQSAPALIRLKGVIKRFNGTVVLSGVDIEIPPGELFGIIGLSGAGKTTLLNVMVGFIEPDAGDVLLQLPGGADVSIFRNRDVVKRMFGFAAQIPSFYGKLTVRENIEHFAALYNIPFSERVRRCGRLLRLVGLEQAQHTLAQNLSGGMQKRLDIACALVHEPAILILDEPTADLDQIIRNQLWDLIRTINRRGTTVIVASHVVSELEQNCSRIAILHNGRISEVGTPLQLRDIYSKMYEVSVRTASKNYSSLKAFCAKNPAICSRFWEKGGAFTVQSMRPQEALVGLLQAVVQNKDVVVGVSLDRPSVAEVFESLVKNEEHQLR